MQNISTEICKYKYNQEKLLTAVFASTKLALNYIKEARCNQKVSKITLATFDFNKHLTINSYLKYLLRFSYFAIISHA